MSPLFYASYVAMWALLLIVSVLVLLVYRHFGLMAMGTLDGVQRDGLPVGEVAPTVVGATGDGREAEWPIVRGRTHLLLFASSGCAPCERVLPALSELSALNKDLRVATILSGPPQVARQLEERIRPSFTCLAQDTTNVFNSYRVRVTPFAFLIGEDGRIRAKGLCSDPGKIVHLFESAEMTAPVVPLARIHDSRNEQHYAAEEA